MTFAAAGVMALALPSALKPITFGGSRRQKVGCSREDLSEPGIEASVMVIAKFLKEGHQVDNILPKSEDGVSLVAMPDPTLAMSTPVIARAPSLSARRGGLARAAFGSTAAGPCDACARERAA